MIDVIKKFKILFDGKQKIKLLILGVITLVGAFMEALGVSIVLPMVTAIMQPNIIYENELIAKVCKVIGLTTHNSFVLFCLILLIVIFAVKNMYLLFEFYLQARFVFNNQFLTKQKMLHAYLSRPYEYFLTANSGEVLRNIERNVDETFILLQSLLLFATESIASLALIITVFVIDPLMTIAIAVIMGIIMVAITKIIKPVLNQKGEDLRKYGALGYQWLLQAFQGIKEIKVSQKEDFFEENYEAVGRKITSAQKWYTVSNVAPRLILEAGCMCTTLGIIAVLICMGKPLEELFPALAAFAMAAVKLMPSANRIVNTFNDVAYQGPAIDRLLDNLNSIKDWTYENAGSTAELTFNNRIELSHIVYSYPNTSANVLDDASMTIFKGVSAGIVGRSGAGKTTAVDVLLGLLPPKSGQVLVDGKDIMDNYPEWLSKVAYIPQSIYMLNDTIKANIVFGSEPEDDKIWKALREAQLEDFVKELPEQLDTHIGEQGVRLSGGQRQRVGIARALYNNPEILVFDEATSALDNETEAAIMDSINNLHGTKTMIIIAHRLQTIEECDTIFRVENGKIREEK